MFFKRRLGTRRKTRPEFGGNDTNLEFQNEKYQQDITTNYLEATNTSPIPLWGNFVSKRLGKRKHLKTRRKLVDRSEKRASTDLGILCIFWPEVLVKIADDVGSDLERAEEHEEETEQDVQAADHQALAHLAINWSPFSSIWKTNNEKNHLSVGWHLQASCMRF